jgi:hypothetical protein
MQIPHMKNSESAGARFGKFGAKLDNNNVLVDFYGGGSSENKANFSQLGLELGHIWKYSDSAKEC